MTEEIIIDGVNVAGCEHYTTMEDCDGIHDLCEQLDDYCSIKKNCYYKQLKRLEQERDFWQNKSCEFENFVDKQVKEIDELKQGNKELGRKAFLAEQNVRTTASTFCEKDNKINELEQENKQIKSALERIKNIVTSPYPGKPKDVLNIINEVLE